MSHQEQAAVASSGPKMVEVSAVVIRADGTREDLGIVASYYRNPLKRLWARLVRRHGRVTFGELPCE